MILTFADSEGDPIAVESAAIVGLSVGSLNGPHTAGADVTVTLIWAAGVAQPFMAAAPFAEVLEAWTSARTAGPPPELKGVHGWPLQAHPGVFPLVQHQYDPSAPPAWKAKTERPT